MASHSQRPSIEYAEIPVFATLEHSAARLPKKIAVYDEERSITYAELNEQAWRCAAALQAMEMQRGDHAGLLLPNCLEFVIAYYGAMRAGCVVTTLNPTFTARELEFQLNDAACSALIVDAGLLGAVREVRRRLASLRHVLVVGGACEAGEAPFDEVLGRCAGKAPAAVQLDVRRDLAVLPYSSGTTGFPKGVMLSHYNLVSNMQQFAQACEICDSEIFLTHLPLFHIYGMNLLMGTAVMVGAQQVLMSQFSPEACLRLIAERRCTVLYTVPPVILWLSQLAHLDRYDLSSLRYVFSGAAPLPIEVAQTFTRRTGVLLNEGYGLTESSPMLISNPLDAVRPGSIGTLVSDTEARVVDVETGGRELPDGEAGELLVRGPQVMLGYWRNDEATAECLDDGWLSTGDLVRRAADGYFTIVDRKKEMIKYRGYQVAPAELEAVLHEHPDVADCAVIGKPDAESGETPKAVVVKTSGSELEADELIEFVATRVAPYKKVREVEFVEVVPKSASGKILRRLLKEREKTE